MGFDLTQSLISDFSANLRASTAEQRVLHTVMSCNAGVVAADHA